MTEQLSPELQRLVAEKLATGRFRSEAEVIAAAKQSFEDWSELHDAWLRWRLRDGIEQAERGEGTVYDFNAFMTRFEASRAK